jgi:hypothetical protein
VTVSLSGPRAFCTGDLRYACHDLARVEFLRLF